MDRRAGHFAAPHWPDPFESIATTANAPRFISLPAQESSQSNAREIVLDPASPQDLEQLADREFELPPPTNILDRVFAGLEFDPRAPRPAALGGLSASVMNGDVALQGYLPAIWEGSNTPVASASAPPAAIPQDTTFGVEEGGGGGGGDPVVGDQIDGDQLPHVVGQSQGIDWISIAVAHAGNSGTVKLVDGEVDITDALTNLARAIADRAEDVGMGGAVRQIIGENPTVDLPVGGESELESGSGESMAMSSGSGSGCGQNSGSNQAPFSYPDEYVVSAILPTYQPPGVLENDVTQVGETMTAILTSGAAYGSVNLLQYGDFTYTPPVPPRASV